MKCSVCGSKSNADARFCANCGAKLNSGAQTLFKTPVSSPSAAAASPLPDAGVGASVTPKAMDLVPLLLGLAAFVVVGYFAYRALMPATSTPGSTTEPLPPTARPAEAVQSGTEASPTAAEPAKSETARPQANGAATAEPPAVVAKGAVTDEPTPAAKAPARPKPSTKTAAPKRPPVAANAPVPPAMSVAALEPVAPVPPPAPAKPDRIAQLSDALARCVGMDLIQRAVCEQRARLQHCEGYWGQVAQCPGGRAALQTN
jgi:hypothetical protein